MNEAHNFSQISKEFDNVKCPKDSLEERERMIRDPFRKEPILTHEKLSSSDRLSCQNIIWFYFETTYVTWSFKVLRMRYELVKLRSQIGCRGGTRAVCISLLSVLTFSLSFYVPLFFLSNFLSLCFIR